MTTTELVARSVVLRRLAAATMAGAAVIHVGVMADHVREWWAAGVFFLVTGIVQLVWALWLWTSPVRRWVLWSGIGVNALLVVVWLVSRTAGLPVGPEAGRPEAIGVADVVCVVLEVAAAALAAAVLPLATRERAASRSGAATTERVGVVTCAVGVLALIAAGGALAVPESHSHDDAGMAGMSVSDDGHTHGTAGSGLDGEQHAMPDLPDVSHVTAEQTAAARTFLETSEADTAAYRDVAKAKAAGFDVAAAWKHKQAKAARLGHDLKTDRVQLIHVPNRVNRTDGKVLDAAAPETLMYSRSPQGAYTLVGIMYTAEKKAPPSSYAPYQRWHFHEQCITTGTGGARPRQSEPTDGACPDGATLRRTGYMTHLWFVSPDRLAQAYAMTAPTKALTAYRESLT